MEPDYQNMSKEELIDLLIKRERYNKTLNKAIRHWAMGLLDELKKIRLDDGQTDVFTDAR